MDHLFTIGAYGFNSGTFFDQLQQAGVDLFLDLRRRRGIRGKAYSFANAVRLRQELGAHSIDYRHMIELAPLQETREIQHREDAEQRVARRQRTSLGAAFIADYTSRCLESFEWTPLISDLEAFRRPVLFCVERSPEACHRALVAARLGRETNTPVTNLMP